MTNSEVARQIHDFRGEYGVNGKPDRLRKLLVRVDLLRSRAKNVAKFVKATDSVTVETGLIFSDVVPMHFSGVAERHQITLLAINDAEGL